PILERACDYIIKEKTVLLQKKDNEGFGFVLRGAKAQTPIEEFTPTPAFPALQYLESVDEGGVAWRAGLRMGDFLIEVNGQNVVKVGHRQVVNMIRQGGNSLMVKVVMVARNPELEDTARKRAPQQTKRLTPPAIALRSKSMTSELEDMGKMRTKSKLHVTLQFFFCFCFFPRVNQIGRLVKAKLKSVTEEERQYLHPPAMKLSRSLSVPGPEEIPPPPNTSAPEPPLSAGPHPGRGPAMPIPPVSQAHYQLQSQPGHPTQAGWDRGGPGGMNQQVIVPTLRRQSDGLAVRETEAPRRGGGKMGGLRRGYSSATPPTSAKPKAQQAPQHHPHMVSRDQAGGVGRGAARRGGRGALMKQSKVEEGLRQHRGKGVAAKETSSIPIPTIIVKAPSTSSSGRSSQGSSMEAEPSQDVDDNASQNLENLDYTSTFALGGGGGGGGGARRERERFRDMRRKSASFFLSSQMEVPTPRLRPSKSIDEGMFSGDSYVNYSSSMPPAFGLPEYSSPITSQDGQPKSAPSMYGTQPATTFIHPLTGKVLDPSSPLGLALAARERALKDDRRTRREDRHFGRQLSTVGSFPTPVQTPTPSLFATPTQSTYTSPVSLHLTSPTTTTSPASLSRPQSPRILRLGGGGGGERMEREKEGGPREGLRVRFSEDRTSQYSTQYYPQSPREKEVYDNRPAPPIQPPPPPAQPAPRRPSFLQMESAPNTSYIPQYTVPTAPTQTHEAMVDARAGSAGGLGLMVLPPPAPSIDADDEFVFVDPLPPPLQFANGKNERGQELPQQRHQIPNQHASAAPPPPPPLPSPKISNAPQSSQGGDSTSSTSATTSATATIIPKTGEWQDAVVDSGIEELDSHSSSDHHLEMLGLSGLRGERGGVGGEGEKGGEHQDLCTSYSGGQTFEVHSAKMANPVFPKMTHYKEGGGRGLSVALQARQVGWVDIDEHDQGMGRVQRAGIALEGRRLHSPLSGVKASIINELSSKLQQMSGMKSMDDWSHTPKSPTMHRFMRRQTFDFQSSPTKEMRSAVSRRRAPSPLIYNTEQPNPTPPRPSSLPILPSTPVYSNPFEFPGPLTPPSPGLPLGDTYNPNPLLVSRSLSPTHFLSGPLPYWTKYDVADWLAYLNLAEHTERFIDNEIDGSHLPSLTKDDFLDLGVTRVGHRMNIERALKKLTDR
uniref:SH3 and multiple ankyrin repeat domains 1 n=1 Tax=Sphaeramia orbicularis TaxID=375764 RepID=A0A673C6I6_9TELE